MGPRLPLVEIASRLASRPRSAPAQPLQTAASALAACIWNSSDRLEAEASLEGLHVLTRVRSDRQRVETRHDAALRDGESSIPIKGHQGQLRAIEGNQRHLRDGEAAEEPEHRRTPVIELDEQPSRLLLGRLVLGEAERVEIVQGHRVRNRLLERREVTRLASCAGVVEVAGSESRAERAS